MQPTGLHPTLRLTLPPSLASPSPECALHTYLTLPSYLFVDKYQLSSPNFLASKHLRFVRSLAGETDLEAPDWTTSKWGSALLLELAPPKSSKSSKAESPWHADIPLHLRYLSPAETGQSNVSIPWPIVFWACPSDEGTKMNTNPFDRVNLGYDGLFGSRTMFYHLQPTDLGKALVEELKAPVMDLKGATWLESGTVLVMLCGFTWVCGKLLRVIGNHLEWSTERPQKRRD